MNNQSLLEALTELEFAALDLHLYLDTHPSEKNAIALYNSLVEQADTVRDKYEQQYGSMFSYIGKSNEDFFNWIDDPWPWEVEFNKRF